MVGIDKDGEPVGLEGLRLEEVKFFLDELADFMESFFGEGDAEFSH